MERVFSLIASQVSSQRPHWKAIARNMNFVMNSIMQKSLPEDMYKGDFSTSSRYEKFLRHNSMIRICNERIGYDKSYKVISFTGTIFFRHPNQRAAKIGLALQDIYALYYEVDTDKWKVLEEQKLIDEDLTVRTFSDHHQLSQEVFLQLKKEASRFDVQGQPMCNMAPQNVDSSS